jgi:hypothetical protein
LIFKRGCIAKQLHCCVKKKNSLFQRFTRQEFANQCLGVRRWRRTLRKLRYCPSNTMACRESLAEFKVKLHIQSSPVSAFRWWLLPKQQEKETQYKTAAAEAADVDRDQDSGDREVASSSKIMENYSYAHRIVNGPPQTTPTGRLGKMALGTPSEQSC